MTQLFSGLNIWARVPEFRLLDKERSGKPPCQKRLQEESSIKRFVPGVAQGQTIANDAQAKIFSKYKRISSTE